MKYYRVSWSINRFPIQERFFKDEKLRDEFAAKVSTAIETLKPIIYEVGQDEIEVDK